MFKKIGAILVTSALVILSSMAFAQTEIVDLGTLSTSNLSDVVDQNVKMLTLGGDKIYQLKLKGQAFTRSELVDAHDQASRKMQSSPNYFRLWFYMDPNNMKINYYVGKADLVISSAKEYQNFLTRYKGKSFTRLDLKLNEYDKNKAYDFDTNTALKGDYWIYDTYVADGTVIRSIQYDPAVSKPSSKTYKVSNYKELSLAVQDGLNNLYDSITIETPSQNDTLFDAFKAYGEVCSSSFYANFSTHIRVYSEKQPVTKKVSGKVVKSTKGVYTLCFGYDRSKADIRDTYAKSVSKAAEINSEILKSTMTPYEKIQAIHDYAVKHITYNLPVVHFQLKDLQYHNVTALLTNDGVCNGYAWSIKALLDNAGIENRVIYGTADIGDGNGEIHHAWNLVKLNGKFYHIDATWDDYDGKNNDFNYAYFMVNDKLISRTHIWDTKLYPVCSDGSLEYYSKNNYVINDPDAFYAYARAQFKTGTTMLTFRSSSFTDEWLDSRLKDAVFLNQPTWTEYWYYSNDDNGLITFTVYQRDL